MRYLLIIILSSTISLNIFSQNDGAGNTGLSFLKSGVGSRSLGMGEAVTSNVTDASATYYNPAALFNGRDVNLLFMHNQNILDIRTEFLAAKFRVKRFAFGVHVNTTYISDIEVREIPGEPIDKFSSRFFSIGVSTAYSVNDKLSVGLTGKFLYEKIYIDNASGVALDIGGLYNSNKMLSIGASIANIGSMNQLREQETKLPTSIRFGAGYKIPLSGIKSSLLVSAEGYKVFDGGQFHLHSGAEFSYQDFLMLRLGFQSGYENRNITAGLGLEYAGFTFDYSFIPYKFSQGSGHTLTIGKFF